MAPNDPRKNVPISHPLADFVQIEQSSQAILHIKILSQLHF
jgi:hypothetical protein